MAFEPTLNARSYMTGEQSFLRPRKGTERRPDGPRATAQLESDLTNIRNSISRKSSSGSVVVVQM